MGKKQPVLFLGHGSPMNAIAHNDFTKKLNQLGTELGQPKAILCISAHWLTEGSLVTSAPNPRMIYDMGGFPEKLYQVQYPAPGAPALAQEITQLIQEPKIQLDQGKWGLDHGTWSVLVHLFPKANIPVLQLSIDFDKDFKFHFDLGKKLRILREMGVLIVGSGNIVHNLGEFSWEEKAPVMDWAQEAADWFTTELLAKNYGNLTQPPRTIKALRRAIPTTEHYIPCLYVLGASEGENPHIEYSEIQNGSIAMTSFSVGLRN